MTLKFNPYQVICIGEKCNLYNKCKNECILKNGLKNRIIGCNYSKEGDCKHCSHRNKCVLIKPYSDELNKIEVKRRHLEKENEKLFEYISEWDDIEKNLSKYHAHSVNEVIYFDKKINSKQKMIDKIDRNKLLIKAYLKKEQELLC